MVWCGQKYFISLVVTFQVLSLLWTHCQISQLNREQSVFEQTAFSSLLSVAGSFYIEESFISIRGQTKSNKSTLSANIKIFVLWADN